MFNWLSRPMDSTAQLCHCVHQLAPHAVFRYSQLADLVYRDCSSLCWKQGAHYTLAVATALRNSVTTVQVCRRLQAYAVILFHLLQLSFFLLGLLLQCLHLILLNLLFVHHYFILLSFFLFFHSPLPQLLYFFTHHYLHITYQPCITTCFRQTSHFQVLFLYFT
jgi:hypothetical protein